MVRIITKEKRFDKSDEKVLETVYNNLRERDGGDPNTGDFIDEIVEYLTSREECIRKIHDKKKEC